MQQMLACVFKIGYLISLVIISFFITGKQNYA